MATTAFLFPDTNLFIQCRQLSELDWSRWADFDQVELVLTRPVQAELDQQKKAQGRVAKRARAANALVGRLLSEDSIEIRAAGPTVRLVWRLELRPAASLAGELNYAERDDQLVGIAAGFAAAHSDATVELLSADNGVLGTAKHVGVKFWPIPDAWLLQPETDADDKRTQALQAQLERYQRAEPKFEAEFGEARFQISQYLPLSQRQVALLMDRIRTHFPMATDFGEGQPKTEPLGLGAAARLLLTMYTPASEEEISAYKEVSYPRWLEECEDRLQRLHQGLSWQEGFPALRYQIENQGSRPAEDAAITFEAKGEFLLSAPSNDEQGDLSREVGLPRPPDPPRGTRRERPSLYGGLPFFQDPVGASRGYDFSNMHDVAPPDPNEFYWHPSRPNEPQAEVSLRCRQWRHQIGPEPFTIIATFPRMAGVIEGAVNVSVHAANLTDPFKATFRVMFEVVEVDAWPEAEALVDTLITQLPTEH